jgi:hypothetical protein
MSVIEKVMTVIATEMSVIRTVKSFISTWILYEQCVLYEK